MWWDLGSARAHLLPRGSGSETGVSAWVRTLLGSSGSGDAESQGRECVCVVGGKGSQEDGAASQCCCA